MCACVCVCVCEWAQCTPPALTPTRAPARTATPRPKQPKTGVHVALKGTEKPRAPPRPSAMCVCVLVLLFTTPFSVIAFKVQFCGFCRSQNTVLTLRYSSIVIAHKPVGTMNVWLRTGWCREARNPNPGVRWVKPCCSQVRGRVDSAQGITGEARPSSVYQLSGSAATSQQRTIYPGRPCRPPDRAVNR